jgi:hypothetical protein
MRKKHTDELDFYKFKYEFLADLTKTLGRDNVITNRVSLEVLESIVKL